MAAPAGVGWTSAGTSKIPHFPPGVPAVGLGTFSYPFVADDVRASVLAALELGYRHLDTAALYGSESAVGKAVAEAVRRGVVASRAEVFVTTKVWCTQCHPHLVLPSLVESLQTCSMLLELSFALLLTPCSNLASLNGV
jgi:diketogulonate reductase-like aldo/keto reductase